jgi:hypothetical protein
MGDGTQIASMDKDFHGKLRLRANVAMHWSDGLDRCEGALELREQVGTSLGEETATVVSDHVQLDEVESKQSVVWRSVETDAVGRYCGPNPAFPGQGDMPHPALTPSERVTATREEDAPSTEKI